MIFRPFSISLPFISEKKCIFYYVRNTHICQMCPFSSDPNNKLVKGELVHMLVHSAAQKLLCTLQNELTMNYMQWKYYCDRDKGTEI